jgi:hypothetical protein
MPLAVICPPSMSVGSSRQVSAPSLAAVTAADSPATEPPTTTRSQLMTSSSPLLLPPTLLLLLLLAAGAAAAAAGSGEKDGANVPRANGSGCTPQIAHKHTQATSCALIPIVCCDAGDRGSRRGRRLRFGGAHAPARAAPPPPRRAAARRRRRRRARDYYGGYDLLRGCVARAMPCSSINLAEHTKK